MQLIYFASAAFAVMASFAVMLGFNIYIATFSCIFFTAIIFKYFHKNGIKFSFNFISNIQNSQIFQENKQIACYIFPQLWKAKKFGTILAIFLVILVERAIMVLYPLYSKWISDALGGTDPYCYHLLIVYAIMDVIEGNAASLRYQLIRQLTSQIQAEMELDLFRHLHQLPLQWHLRKKTGKITEIIDSGVNSLWSIFDIWLDLLPGLLDVAIAMVVFVVHVDSKFGGILAITLCLYLGTLMVGIRMTKKFSKKKAKLNLDHHSNIVDSLINYETIKYYCAEEYELERFREGKIKTLALSSRKGYYRLTTGILSESILNIGFFFGTLLLVDKIARGADGATPGDYMLYGIYVKNLKEPIESFAYRYDLILENITNVHMLLQLLSEKTENNSIENPIGMSPSSDAIEFKNVSFEYVPGMPVLRDLSFRIEAGKTLALVGESGSGKSTIIRLLFRLIEPSKGQILFGGRNIL